MHVILKWISPAGRHMHTSASIRRSAVYLQWAALRVTKIRVNIHLEFENCISNMGTYSEAILAILACWGVSVMSRISGKSRNGWPFLSNACWQKTRGRKKHSDSLWFLSPSSGPSGYYHCLLLIWWIFGLHPLISPLCGQPKTSWTDDFSIGNTTDPLRPRSFTFFLALPAVVLVGVGIQWGPMKWNLRYQGHILSNVIISSWGPRVHDLFMSPSLILQWCQLTTVAPCGYPLRSGHPAAIPGTFEEGIQWWWCAAVSAVVHQIT